jgi:ribosomal protein S4
MAAIFERRLLFLDHMAAILERRLFVLFLDNMAAILERRLPIVVLK